MNYLLKPIDAFLDRMTMYRVVLYVLTGLIAAAAIESAFGLLPYSPWAILLSAVLAVATCWGANEILAWILKAATGTESAYITAFILVLILPPAAFGNFAGAFLIVAAGIMAMTSKYVFAYQKRHFFNPAAFGVAATGILMGGYASWWVAGNLALLPFVLLGGLAVVRKIRRFDAVIAFAVVAVAAIVLTSHAGNLLVSAENVVLHTSLLFFAFIMLTEPATLPPTRLLRVIYAALVGIAFAPAFHIGSFYFSPELALLAGNIFSFFVGSKGRSEFTLLRIEDTSASTKDFVFASARNLPYLPGQYLEWTLPHEKPDARGTRRYFTIASSPTEDEIRLGVRFYPKPSTFKQALAKLSPGGTVTATQVSGEFTLPKDAGEKLAFIAGGIGITPFRSMLRYLLDRNERRDIVLLYGNRNPEDIAYGPLLTEAENALGMKTAHVMSGNAGPGMRSGFMTAEVITSEIPDYKERTFFLSGPQVMVTSVKEMLGTLGVPGQRIRTDYFPGLA